MIDLNGKVAAVTGAAVGIAAEVARTLAKAGMHETLLNTFVGLGMFKDREKRSTSCMS